MECEYRLFWNIENYSYFKTFYPHLKSPKFITEKLAGTSWNLALDPESLNSTAPDSYPVGLRRSFKDEGPEDCEINFELAITTVDGSILYSVENECTFRNMTELYFRAFVDIDGMFFHPENGAFLPQDTLCVRCRMRWGEGIPEKVTQCTVRTRIEIENISVLLKVENFRALEINEKKTFEFPTVSETGFGFSASFEISDRYDDESIVVKIHPFDDRYLHDGRDFYLIDASSNAIKIYDYLDGYNYLDDDSDGDYNFYDEGEYVSKLTRGFILGNEEKYLPNGELTLMCELRFSYEDCLSKETLHDIPKSIYLAKYPNAHFKSDNKDCEQSARSANMQVIETIHLQFNEAGQNSSDNASVPLVSNQIDVSTIQEETNNGVVELTYPSVVEDLKAFYTNQPPEFCVLS